MILAFLVLCAYACFSGWKDAILWSKKGADAFPWNEHLVFVAERAAVGTLVFVDVPIGQKLIVVVCWLAAFSFLHNGFYYETRKRIDVPYYHWFADSTTSTATIQMNAPVRSLFFGVAVLFLITYAYL
jgi:hypothetical protein